MTQEEILIALAQAIGSDITAEVTALRLEQSTAVTALRSEQLAANGDLTTLSTTAKNSLVVAINEVLGVANAANSAVGTSESHMVGLLAALKEEILGGASAAYDTLVEIQHALEGDDSELANLLTAVTNRVRFDAAQTLTDAQKLLACQNIGIGNPAVDLVAVYNAARHPAPPAVPAP